jgi:hypothetical protein
MLRCWKMDHESSSSKKQRKRKNAQFLGVITRKEQPLKQHHKRHAQRHHNPDRKKHNPTTKITYWSLEDDPRPMARHPRRLLQWQNWVLSHPEKCPSLRYPFCCCLSVKTNKTLVVCRAKIRARYALASFFSRKIFFAC